MAFSSRQYDLLAYCEPRSECTISPAGEVALESIDVEEEDLIKLECTLTKRREPAA
ncbi:MAG: hypothetical protein R3F50_04870 [Gammaproteobacteria bacterium]|jgi:hypothetical protein